jgi:molecular chaperone HtpG
MMKIPPFLSELIQTDHLVASMVDGAIARFEPWVGNSQMPLFPEYTDHSVAHVEDVMSTAVDLATPKARRLFSVKDAATLVLAVCLHDAAMHLTEDGFFSLVRKGSPWRPVQAFDRQT